MAWCARCDGNYQITSRVDDDFWALPTSTKTHNLQSAYVGYEAAAVLGADISTVPRCSNCYSEIEFPTATSEKEYFDMKRTRLLGHWPYSKPVEPNLPDLGVKRFIVLYVLAIMIMAIAYPSVRSEFTRLIMMLVASAGTIELGYLIFKRYLGRKYRYSEVCKEYKREVKAWQSRLNKLQLMRFSEQSYQSLKSMSL